MMLVVNLFDIIYQGYVITLLIQNIFSVAFLWVRLLEDLGTKAHRLIEFIEQSLAEEVEVIKKFSQLNV